MAVDRRAAEGLDSGGGDAVSTAVVALRILELVAASRPDIGVSELAARLGIPKARVHRHLVALKRFHYVAQNRKSRYSIGWRFFSLAHQTTKDFDLLELARPAMTDLRDRLGQTVTISTYLDDEVVVLDFVPGTTSLEIGLRPGSRFRFNWVAQGKVVLAFAPQALVDRFLRQKLVPRTRATIVTAARLKREIEIVRKQGWADAPEEVYLGINAVAAPIFCADGRLFGSVALVGAIHDLPSPPSRELIKALKWTASQLSEVLGEVLEAPAMGGA